MRLAIASLAAVTAFGVAALAQDNPSSKAYMDVHSDVMAKMQKMKPSGDPDKDFLTMMISHHKGGVDMAEVEMKYGKDEKTRDMAAKVLKGQKAEIAEMEEILRGMK